MVTNIVGHNTTAQTATTDKYSALQIGAGTFATAETGLQARSVMPCAGTLQNFYVQIDTASGAGITRNFVIRKNGVDQSMTAPITGATAVTANDTVNTVSFVAGDLIAVHTSATATTASTGKIRWTLGANCAANVSMLLSNSSSAMGTTFPVYLPVQGQGFDATVAGNVESVMPTGGTIKNIYIKLSAAPALTKDLTFTLWQAASGGSSSATGLAVVVTGDGTTTAFNASANVTITAGDRLYWKVTSTLAPASLNVSIGAEFDPTTDGESVQTAGTSTTGALVSNTRYEPITSNAGTALATSEANVSGLTQAATWKKLYVVEETAITAGSHTYTPQINGSASGPSVVMNSSQQTVGNDTSTTANSTVGQTISMGIVTVATPPSSVFQYGIVSFISPSAIKQLSALGVG